MIKSFSLPDDAVDVLEKIPKNECSDFVANAILQAAQNDAKLKALQAIKNFPRMSAKKGQSIMETLRKNRQQEE